jgi:predicted transcriptional regulator
MYTVRMSTKTIYVQPADEPLWEWLRALADRQQRSVSYMLARAIEALKAASS